MDPKDKNDSPLELTVEDIMTRKIVTVTDFLYVAQRALQLLEMMSKSASGFAP